MADAGAGLTRRRVVALGAGAGVAGLTAGLTGAWARWGVVDDLASATIGTESSAARSPRPMTRRWRWWRSRWGDGIDEGRGCAGVAVGLPPRDADAFALQWLCPGVAVSSGRVDLFMSWVPKAPRRRGAPASGRVVHVLHA
jgi:hypothetical protein